MVQIASKEEERAGRRSKDGGQEAPITATNGHSAKRAAIRIAVSYALWSALWIFCSGWALHHFVHEEARAALWENLKGWFFVLVTAVLLGLVMHRTLRRLEASSRRLRESEARLRILSNNLPDTYVFQYVQDAEGRPCFTFVSGGVESVHGVKPEAVLRDANALFGLVVPEQLDDLFAKIAESARNMTDFEMEVWGQLADGRRQLMHLHSRPRRGANGSIQWDGISTDITARRQMENAARESAYRYQSLFENMLNGFAHCRMIYEDGKPVDFVYLEVNPAYGKLTGLRDAAGKRVSELIPGIREKNPELFEFYGRAADTGTPQRFETYLEPLQKWFTVSAYSPAKGEFVSIFDVITERKQAEFALAESERNYREIFNATNEAIFLHDATTGRVLDVNDTTLRMHGYESKEEFLAGNMEKHLIGDLPYTWDEAKRRMRLAIEQGPQTFEWLNRRKNGERFWVEVSLKSSQVGGEGRILAVVRDINERKLAAEALRQSERLKNAVLDSMMSHIAVLDRDGVIVAVNERWRDFARENPADGGVSAGNLETGANYLEACRNSEGDSAHDGMDAHDGIVAVMQGRQPTFALEYPCDSLTKKRWFQMVVSPLGKSGDGVVVSHTDITERKLAEEFVHQNESRFRALIEHAPDGIVMMNTERRIIFASPSAIRMFGLEGVDLSTIDPDDSTHPDDLPRVHALLGAILRNPSEIQTAEYRFRHTNGEWVWIESIFTNMLGLAGVDAIVINFRSIAERKKAEEALRRSEQEFRAMFEMASIGMAQADPTTGRLLRVNRRQCQTLGYTEEELLGLSIAELTYPEDRERDRELFQKVIRGDVPEYHWEKRYRRKDGEVVWGNVYMTVVRDATGKPLRAMAAIEDITARRKLEEQFRQSQKMEAIGQLAGGVAHDFNNILSVIMLHSDLIRMQGGLPKEVVEGIGEITESAHRATALTRQLLAFSRRQVMQPRDLDLNESVTSVAKMLQRIIGEDVKLQLHLHSAPLNTHADPGMIDQVLLNLAVNARDAMPEGGTLIIETSAVTVRKALGETQEEVEPGPYVCVQVTDTGCGIPKEVLPRIFEPFFTTKETGKGTGLGLATVFGIVKQHKGGISVVSEPGKGTTFRIFLPECPAKPFPGVASIVKQPNGGTETILLVEDDPVVRVSAKMLLSRYHYAVLEAADGVDALKLWEQNRDRIDLLLSDLVMPGGMTGKQLGKRMRAEKPNLPIVYMSGFSPELAGRELELQPGEAFIQKPFTPDEILRTIRACLTSRQSA